MGGLDGDYWDGALDVVKGEREISKTRDRKETARHESKTGQQNKKTARR